MRLDDFFKKDQINTAFRKMVYPGGGTFTGKALTQANRLLSPSMDRGDKPNVVIVITDGRAYDDVIQPSAILRTEKGANIYVIGVGKYVDPGELEQMAANAANVYRSDFDQLDNVIPQILLQINKSACRDASLNERQQPVGMQSGAISDAQISASSQLDGNHTARQARLHCRASGGKAGSWSAFTNDQNQWLQVDFGGETDVTRIATQGRNANNQWVTRYKLQYSIDGVSLHYYKDNKVFEGNIDSDTVVVHKLNPPIRARYIWVRPVAWHVNISMRIELYGCSVCDKDFDLIFVIDGSGSIEQARRGNFNLVKRFITGVVNGFEVGYNTTHVGAVIYSSSRYVRTVMRLDDFFKKDQINAAFCRMVYPSGGTFTGKALTRANELLSPSVDRDDKPNVVIVITDGRAYDDVIQPSQILKNEKGATIFVIGVGEHVDQGEMEQMTGNAANVFTAGFYQLNNVKPKLLSQIMQSACPDQLAEHPSGRRL